MAQRTAHEEWLEIESQAKRAVLTGERPKRTRISKRRFSDDEDKESAPINNKRKKTTKRKNTQKKNAKEGKGSEDNVKQNCTECEDEEKAIAWCAACKKRFCDLHLQLHSKTKKTSKHSPQFFEKQIPRCSDHPQEQLQMFCFDCNIFICRDCALREHKLHHYEFFSESESQVTSYFRNTVDRAIFRMTRITANLQQEYEDAIEEEQRARQRRIELEGKLKKSENLLKEVVETTVNDIPSIISVQRTFNERFSRILGVAGQLLFSFGSKGYLGEGGKLFLPCGVTVHKERIIVADTNNHRIQVFNPAGNFLFMFGKKGSADGEFLLPYGVAVDQQERMIVVDKKNHRVQVFKSSGKFLFRFGSKGSEDGDFQYPQGVTVDRQQRIVVADTGNHRVQVFDSSGTFLFSFGGEGSTSGRFKWPHGVAVDQRQRMIVADKCNHRIQVFDSSGQFLFRFGFEGSSVGHFRNPTGVTVGPLQQIVVADAGNERVQVFDANGKFQLTFGPSGEAEDKFCPYGIAVGEHQNIVVADATNCRIQVFE